jgi:hypothetical protein
MLLLTSPGLPLPLLQPLRTRPSGLFLLLLLLLVVVVVVVVVVSFLRIYRAVLYFTVRLSHISEGPEGHSFIFCLFDCTNSVTGSSSFWDAAQKQL